MRRSQKFSTNIRTDEVWRSLNSFNGISAMFDTLLFGIILEGLRLLYDGLCRLKWASSRYSSPHVALDLETENRFLHFSKLPWESFDFGKKIVNLKSSMGDAWCILCPILFAKKTARLCSRSDCVFQEKMLFFLWHSFSWLIRLLKSYISSSVSCAMKILKIFAFVSSLRIVHRSPNRNTIFQETGSVIRRKHLITERSTK